MKRRSALLLLTLTGLAGCADAEAVVPDAGASAMPSADLRWPLREPDLAAGFCFTLVQGFTPKQVIDRLGGKELERVKWAQLVGPGDGEAGAARRYFVGLTRFDDWTLIAEDAGDLGVTEEIVRPLSEGRRVLAYRSDATGRGRLLVIEDGEVLLDFDSGTPERWGGSQPGDFVPAMRTAGLLGGTDVTEPTGPALSFLADRTGVTLTREQLNERTYLLVTVPK
ncbi:hypothetical protein AMIS_120 [Actinoplanes missouriensis 431]|uniref:Lipoprotein n=1 Tax=Actinoplanes missouriensis (strain ATCC 14538 / DSM 43046 / CBS 188.64 / JCM 3121 / NBRC 102363 / NCIMB 12654 / NRRL B-3342 / UNCC 431) TaxID=512565 RepID=I0GWU5_ACTM4|nr:DUF6461 domain-containing protein [Actinoplanes missouriensis]BAL85232.1 hypothetical protein AMIS_120 [Actinoplanes missouriensis 431]